MSRWSLQPRPRTRPRTARLAELAGLPALVLALSGCSHTAPYYAPAALAGATDSLGYTEEAVVARVLLIGDAGASEPGEPVLAQLTRWASILPARTLVAFLGDNVYPYGLVDELDPDLHKLTTRRLDRQIDVIRSSRARAVFLPGNHDWAGGGADGLIALDRQERRVEAALGRGTFEPSGGCAGPEAIDLDGVRIVVLDSEWLLQEHPASPCPDTIERFTDELATLVDDAGDRVVLVLGHHPIATHGPHGGFFTWRDHLFPLTRLASWAYVPLPGVGSLYPLVRGKLRASHQDLGHSRYDRFVTTLTDAVRSRRPLVYAAGHEHGLQVLEGDDAFHYVLVSGAGSSAKISTVTEGEDTLFAHAHEGFMCLDVLENGRVALRVVEPGAGVVFSRWLTTEG